MGGHLRAAFAACDPSPTILGTGLPGEAQQAAVDLTDATAIDALLTIGNGDRLQVQRLKKRKLALRDRMAFLDDQLTPDIIA